MKKPLAFACPILVGLALVLWGWVSSAGASPLRTVAFSGVPAPGMGSQFLFSSFVDFPVLNNTGQTAFLGRITGAGVNASNNLGIWSEGGGDGLALIAREGNAAPGTPSGVNFTGFAAPVLNNAGQTAFRGTFTGIRGDARNTRGIWSERRVSGLALVVRSGNEAPVTSSGINFSNSFGPHVFNDAGQTAFLGLISGTDVHGGNNRGIWSEGGGNALTLVARSGNAAPDTSSGVSFSSFNSRRFFSRIPVFNNAGQTAFWGRLTGEGINFLNDSGIWLEGVESGLALVARAGNAAPGTSSETHFSGFGSPVLNDMGQTAFSGVLTGMGVDNSNDRGIWSEGGSNGLTLVARAGNAAPDTTSGVNFFGFGTPVLNGAGQTAFLGSLTGLEVDSTNNAGIWSEGGGSGLSLVARLGNEAPGTSSGVKFSSFTSLGINGLGQTAFVGRLTGMGVNGSNNTGLWAEDLSGVLTLIAREGDLLDVDDGPAADFRTIRDFDFRGGTGNEDGRPSSFNDFGQLAFSATFTDGTSGVFVSNLVAVPEPTSVVLVAAWLLGLGVSSRRRKK